MCVRLCDVLSDVIRVRSSRDMKRLIIVSPCLTAIYRPDLGPLTSAGSSRDSAGV